MTKQTISDINLYNLMAEDFGVWLGKNKTFGYVLHVESLDKDGIRVQEDGLHPCAIDSLAEFCRRFLHDYDSIQSRDAA